MKRKIDLILKVVLSLMLLMPILGILGIFPAPTAEMYSNPKSFEFIKILADIQYINIIMALVFVFSLFFIWTKRTALAVLLILPITINIVGFHAFVDGGLFTGGAMMGNIMFLINIYFIYQNRSQYKNLLIKNI